MTDTEWTDDRDLATVDCPRCARPIATSELAEHLSGAHDARPEADIHVGGGQVTLDEAAHGGQR